MMGFTKVLVANRGEIALRVIRSAAAMGYGTVAVYSDADRHALHVTAADQAVRIGPSAAAESYLDIERIIEAARSSGADAVHPGYGFLAENADFARTVEDAGLVFIGPTADAIDLMGSKRASKLRMIEAGVPCTPGYEGEHQDDDTLIAEAKRIGCPVMVKASAGGGGRGMRLVESEDDLGAAIQSARSEAENAFGSGELILEKAVVGARHVEIQVFADTHGNVIHVGERDCSIQRRHQKVVEEAPSPAVGTALRDRMGAAAVDAAAAIEYRGAGTVEFLLDSTTGDFYFMEMNTRLQVEHPVTEMITGLDLVAWQLRVAAGEPLPLAQEEITFDGHAIEVRLCAEDPAADFMPQTGRIHAWREPAGIGIRADHCVAAGGEISPFYDSMVGKIIAWGQTREIARQRLSRALGDTLFLGPTSNRDFLHTILAHDVFAGGDFDIGFIGKHMEAGTTPEVPPVLHRALAGAILQADGAADLATARNFDCDLIGWRSAYDNETPLVLTHGDTRQELRVSSTDGGRYNVQIDDERIELVLDHADGTRIPFEHDGVQRHADYVRRGDLLWLCAEGVTAVYDDVLRRPPDSAQDGGDGRFLARMDGKIQRVDVAEGDQVTVGQTLLVLEAMKMEFVLEADVDGVVEELHCAAGDQVAARQFLIVINPE